MTQERKTLVRPAAAELLGRPLSPRSLIGSLLLGMRPPRMSGARLVEWCGLFGVAPGTARVALSRMLDRQELVASNGVYELAGRIRRRLPAQDWSLAPEPAEWDGTWLLGVVEAGARSPSERAALRDAGRQLRMVEVREGVLTRPQNLPRAAAPGEAWTQADAQCTWWTARPDAEGAAFAAGLFEKDAWAERAAMFVGHLDGSIANVRTGAGPAIADAFVVGAAALAHVRADPLLPAELCGPDWPGDALRVAYRNFQRAFSDAVREWFRNR